MAPGPLTPAVFHILLALTEGPLHGYAIMQSVDASSGAAMGPGTIYGTLERLETCGYVKELPAARTYPREFRERFAADLESDFLEMARTRGTAFAWRRVLTDLGRSLALTASDAAAERARTTRIGGPIVPPGETF